MNLVLSLMILALIFGVASVSVLAITCYNMKEIRQARIEIDSRRKGG